MFICREKVTLNNAFVSFNLFQSKKLLITLSIKLMQLRRT